MDATCVYWGDFPLADPACVLKRPTCDECTDRLSLSDPQFSTKWVDPLIVTDRARVPTTALRNLLHGASAFLMAGGPSANELPLEMLARRGCWTMAVNNSAGHPRVRPQAMVCSDPPSKFSHSIWLDPAVMKFVPIPKLASRRGSLRRKWLDGKFTPLDRATITSPNVWGFQRTAWLFPDDRFFTSNGACWGNHKKGVEVTSQPKTVCTMLLGLRLMRYLGCKRLFLVGVDFKMTPEAGYSFEQGRTPEACASNNRQFAVVMEWIQQMQDTSTFTRFGMEVYNCNQYSGLRAFPYVPFEEAVVAAQGICESCPDLAGWYEKN